MRRSVVPAVLLLAGCPRSCRVADAEPAVLMPALVRPGVGPGQAREYRYVHMETTGLTQGIFVPGSVRPKELPEGFPDVKVEFSTDSDPDAVRAFHALRGEVLMPNSGGDRKHDGIVIVGVLYSDVRMTPDDPRMATSEPYQAFRLVRWYLGAPFPRWMITAEDEERHADGWEPTVAYRDRLTPEDFEVPVAGDLSRFVRPR